MSTRSFRDDRNALIRGIRAGLRGPVPLLGCFVSFSDERLVEVWAAAGMDLVALDLEHGALGTDRTDAIIATAVRAGIAPLVRVSASDRQIALRALDSGAVGVMVADVRSADQVRQWRDAVEFPPAGSRGVSSTRANDWGLPSLAIDDVESPLLVPMIETAAAVEAAVDLFATGAGDWWHIGRTDLTHDLGGTGVDDAVARIHAAASDIALGDNAGPATSSAPAGARVVMATDRQFGYFGAHAFGRHRD
jgi:4-hydroxy-2-oxoheptanedioate aldolase